LAVARVKPEVPARFHPDTPGAFLEPGEHAWPQFNREGCPGPLVMHMGKDDEERQWFECFGTCELTNETLLAHIEVHGCVQGIGEKLGVTITKPCPSCS
jgi:hypothetical protein